MIVASVIVAVLALTGGAAWLARRAPRRPARANAGGPQRVLFPFVAGALSRRALDAALRLARAEQATLVPVFLARVPLHLPLDAPLPRQAGLALPLQEAIEQRAAAFGVAIDARIERGRTSRHALRQTMDCEQFDQIVMAAAARGEHGFAPEDVAWLLENAPGEIVVLRPGSVDPVIRLRDPRRANGRASEPARNGAHRAARGTVGAGRAAER